MYNRLYTFLCENKILYEKPFRFQTANSTDHPIIQLINEVSKSFYLFTLEYLNHSTLAAIKFL